MDLIINIIYNEQIAGQAIFPLCGKTEKAYQLFRPIAELYNGIKKNKTKSDAIKMITDIYEKSFRELTNMEKAILLLQESGAMFESVDEIAPLFKECDDRLKIPLFIDTNSPGQIHLTDFVQPNEENKNATISFDCSKGMVSFSVFQSKDIKEINGEYEEMEEYGPDLDCFDTLFIDDIGEVIQNLPLISQGKLIERIKGEKNE